MIRPFLIVSLALALLGQLQAAFPKITGFNPKKGPPGTTVTITGSNFLGLQEVDFSGNTKGAIIGANATTIVVLVPADAQTGPLSVVTASGQGDSGAVYFQAAPRIKSFFVPGKTQFDFFGNPILPITATAGDTLTIQGFNFNDAPLLTAVYVGGAMLAVAPVAETQLSIQPIPTTAQSGPVIVTTSGGSVTNGTLYFNPIVTGFTTPAAVGATVNIIGKSLLDVTEVRFGSVLAPFINLNGTNIQAVVPAGATDGKLTVKAPGGSYITITNFVVAPMIASFSPAGGPIGQVVTLTGTALTGTKSVLFGAVTAAKFTNINATTVTAVVPVGSFTAPLTLTTGNGSATSSIPFFVAPTISTISPLSGQVGVVVTLMGINFTGVSKVELSGVALAQASFVVTATNKITVTVPDGSVTGKFRITTPGGVAESAETFTVIGPVPTISGFSPSVGPVGTMVTISGNNLASATKVEFNGVNATFHAAGNDLVATVPAAATTGTIRVTTPAGQFTSTASFLVGTSADLKVTLTPSIDPAIAYSPLNYSVQVVNRGPLPAANATLTFTLPAGAAFDSVSGSPNFELLGRDVVFTLGTLGVNGSLSASVRIRAGAPGTLTTVLKATSETSDTIIANNSATANVTAILPSLTLESLGAGSFLLQWPSAATTYVLESAPALRTPSLWSTVTKAPDDDTVNKSLQLTTDQPAAFYRLRLNQ
jgi:hypothetical protein